MTRKSSIGSLLILLFCSSATFASEHLNAPSTFFCTIPEYGRVEMVAKRDSEQIAFDLIVDKFVDDGSQLTGNFNIEVSNPADLANLRSLLPSGTNLEIAESWVTKTAARAAGFAMEEPEILADLQDSFVPAISLFSNLPGKVSYMLGQLPTVVVYSRLSGTNWVEGTSVDEGVKFTIEKMRELIGQSLLSANVPAEDVSTIDRIWQNNGGQDVSRQDGEATKREAVAKNIADHFNYETLKISWKLKGFSNTVPEDRTAIRRICEQSLEGLTEDNGLFKQILDSLQIISEAPPKAIISGMPEKAKAGETVTLTAALDNGMAPTRYEWDLGGKGEFKEAEGTITATIPANIQNWSVFVKVYYGSDPASVAIGEIKAEVQKAEDPKKVILPVSDCGTCCYWYCCQCCYCCRCYYYSCCTPVCRPQSCVASCQQKHTRKKCGMLSQLLCRKSRKCK